MLVPFIAGQIGHRLESKHLSDTPAQHCIVSEHGIHVKPENAIPVAKSDPSKDEDGEGQPATFAMLGDHDRNFTVESAAFDNLGKQLAKFVFGNESAQARV